jgi:hypothetical protein
MLNPIWLSLEQIDIKLVLWTDCKGEEVSTWDILFSIIQLYAVLIWTHIGWSNIVTYPFEIEIKRNHLFSISFTGRLKRVNYITRSTKT